MAFVVGLDWGGAAHAVCVLEREGGAVVDRFEARHDAAGLREMLRRLARWATPAELAVAMERPSGLIVDALVAAGHPVVPIHPNAVRASRPRYRASGAKDDRGDAYLLADLLRTVGHRFRPLGTPSDCDPRPARAHPAAATTSWRPAFSSPTSCAACLKASGRAQQPSSPTSTAQSRWPSSTAFPPATAPRGSGRSASRASSLSAATAADVVPRRCSTACALCPRASRAPPRPRRRARWSARWSPPSRLSSPASPISRLASATTRPNSRTAASS